MLIFIIYFLLLCHLVTLFPNEQNELICDMPYLKYRAVDKSGKIKEEILETGSEEDLVESLQAQGFYVLSVSPVSQVKQSKKPRENIIAALR